MFSKMGVGKYLKKITSVGSKRTREHQPQAATEAQQPHPPQSQSSHPVITTKSGGNIDVSYVQQDTPLLLLPDELSMLIFSLIDIKSMGALSLVCRQYYWLSKKPLADAKKRRKIALSSLKLLKVIGEGISCRAYQAVHMPTGKLLCVKSYNKKHLLERNEKEHIMNMVGAFKRIWGEIEDDDEEEEEEEGQHNKERENEKEKEEKKEKEKGSGKGSGKEKKGNPFVMQIHATRQTNEKLFVLGEFYNGGELFSLIREEEKLAERTVQVWAAQMVAGLEDLHQRNILLRDLNSEDIVLDRNGNIHFADLSIVKLFNSPTDRTLTFCGAPDYLSPEILKGQPYGFPQDRWALGALIYEMLTGLPPMYDEKVQTMFRKILQGQMTFPSYLSSEVVSLLQSMLNVDPDNRATCEQIKSHAWFKDIDWDQVWALELKPYYIPSVKGADDISFIDSVFTSERIIEVIPDESEPVTKDIFEGFDWINPRSSLWK